MNHDIEAMLSKPMNINHSEDFTNQVLHRVKTQQQQYNKLKRTVFGLMLCVVLLVMYSFNLHSVISDVLSSTTAINQWPLVMSDPTLLFLLGTLILIIAVSFGNELFD